MLRRLDYRLPAEIRDALDRPWIEDVGAVNAAMVRASSHPDDASVPDSAEYIRISGGARAVEQVHNASHLLALLLYDVTDKALDEVAKLQRLRALCLYKLNRADITRIGGSPLLEYLRIDWAHHVGSLSFLSDFPQLKTLALTDLRRFDFASLPEMRSVLTFDIAGAIWTDMKVDSLDPITQMGNLRVLKIGNVRVADGTLRPLSKLQHLIRLDLANLWPIAEHARLAASLPGVRGRGLEPIFAELGSVNACKKCRNATVMLTGKPARIACPKCDARIIQKRIEAWEAAKQPW